MLWCVLCSPLCYAQETDDMFIIPAGDYEDYIPATMDDSVWVVDGVPAGDASSYSLGGDGFSTSTSSNTCNITHNLRLYEVYDVPCDFASYFQKTISASTTGSTYSDVYRSSGMYLNGSLFTGDPFNSTQNYMFGYRVSFSGLANPILFDMGDNATVIYRGLIMKARMNHGPGGNTVANYNFKPEAIQYIDLYYTDVNGERYFLRTIENPADVVSYNSAESCLTLRLDFGKMPDDAYVLDFELFFNGYDAFYKSEDITDNITSVKFGYGHHADLFDVTLKITDGSAGFFASIIQWLQNILSAITGGFSSLIDKIVSLPGLIWSYIESGLKSLFVPSADDMAAIKQDWDTLLHDRFGALYDVVDIIGGYADTFTDVSARETITFPTVNLSLAGSDVAFGGWEVPIRPHEKFDFLFDTLRLIVNIVCTCLFLNGLSHRFSNLLGGESD